MKRLALVLSLTTLALAPALSSAQQRPAAVPTPTDVKPGSITCEDVAYPYPTSYLPLTLYGQDVRIAFMDVPPLGQPNGHTVVLFHGNNFAGFYFGGPIDALRKEGFRVIAPDQIGYGRSSKPIIPYNFHDMARNTRQILQSLKIDKAMIVGHSMGGMLAARFATQYPDVTERLVLYNPIGLTDPRYDRPWDNTDELYKRTLASTYPGIRASIMRYVAHNEKAWTPEFETYTRIRYSWTLGADWPRLAMVQTLINQVQYLDPVINDWAHIKAPTLVFGGADDMLAGTVAVFQERMKYISQTIPDGKARLLVAARSGTRAASRGARAGVSATRRVPQGGAHSGTDRRVDQVGQVRAPAAMPSRGQADPRQRPIADRPWSAAVVDVRQRERDVRSGDASAANGHDDELLGRATCRSWASRSAARPCRHRAASLPVCLS